MGLGAAAVQLADATVGFVLSMTVIARKKSVAVSRTKMHRAKVSNAFASAGCTHFTVVLRPQAESARENYQGGQEKGERKKEGERDIQVRGESTTVECSLTQRPSRKLSRVHLACGSVQ